jgi:hypothetical protein
MHQKAARTLGVFMLGAIVAVLAFTSYSTAAVKRVMELIAPTSKSSVADINGANNWTPSTFSRDGFKKVTHPAGTGIYCLFGRSNPDNSMLELTIDAQHTDFSVVLGPIDLSWDRSSPDCGAGAYEVVTRAGDTLSDDVAFFAQAYTRA